MLGSWFFILVGTQMRQKHWKWVHKKEEEGLAKWGQKRRVSPPQRRAETQRRACILGYRWGQLEALFQMLAPHLSGQSSSNREVVDPYQYVTVCLRSCKLSLLWEMEMTPVLDWCSWWKSVENMSLIQKINGALYHKYVIFGICAKIFTNSCLTNVFAWIIYTLKMHLVSEAL